MTTTTHRGHTITELARRWHMSEEKALEFLEAFEKRGFARQRGKLWFATEKASRIQGFGPEGG